MSVYRDMSGLCEHSLDSAALGWPSLLPNRPLEMLMLRPLAPQVRTKDVLFESISHLIDYHLQNGQPIVAAESELHLRSVVKREP